MDKEYFSVAKWIAAYLGGGEDGDSKQKLDEWRQDERNERLLRKIEADNCDRRAQRRYDDFCCEKGWEQMQAKRSGHGRRLYLYRLWGGVAALLLLALGAGLFLQLRNGGEENGIVPVAVQSIEPGKSKATLILSDGKEINLVEQQGMIPDSLTSIRNADDRLVYQTEQKTTGSSPVFHEMVIPVCGEYQLELSDGTVVYLNAKTKLRFPNYFEGAARVVELEGEAYFKVAKNPGCPFVVKSANSTVYVYGTQFNISAYPDERETHTTLVEGSLAVENAGQRRTIHPGERWCYDKMSGEIMVKAVDVSLYSAWKDGKLRFNDAPLEEIMKTISRWYGVEVNYETEELRGLRFGCNFSRHSSIEPVLRVFEANGKIRIERNGNELKIKRGR